MAETPPLPPGPPVIDAGRDRPFGERQGEMVGPYRLLEVIGEGGFGTVWLAERREPYVQRVALKIIKPGMDSRAVIARFEHERQALALMDHPNVARVLDGGITAFGRPYFVMEYVKGEAITSFCDRQRMTVRDRLRLFVGVCEAVQHAHMKGIIHRDIKPSNILVSAAESTEAGEVAAGAVVKVIDFGIAKAMSQALTEKTVVTEQGVVIGTPEYMSPEQAEVGAVDIDTRSDVYSLGVTLYELLTGVLPLDPREVKNIGYGEFEKMIREVDPPTPSARLMALMRTGRSEELGARRGCGVKELVRTLRRELEWIPLKAMRKEKGARYASPGAMAADISRYLSDLPLEARPAGLWYRGRKFVRRRRMALAAGLVLMVLVFGPGGGLRLIVGAADRVQLLISQLPGIVTGGTLLPGDGAVYAILGFDVEVVTAPLDIRLDAGTGRFVAAERGGSQPGMVAAPDWLRDETRAFLSDVAVRFGVVDGVLVGARGGIRLRAVLPLRDGSEAVRYSWSGVESVCNAVVNDLSKRGLVGIFVEVPEPPAEGEGGADGRGVRLLLRVWLSPTGMFQLQSGVEADMEKQRK